MFLSELPADIRLQIENALKKRKCSSSNEAPSIKQHNVNVESQKPGCSFWQSQSTTTSLETDQSEKATKKCAALDENIVALPSFSQVLIRIFSLAYMNLFTKNENYLLMCRFLDK